MYIYRNINWRVVLRFAWSYLLIFTVWNLIVYFIFHFLEHEGINPHIPFLPLSTIGIAVAFYIGFKNNASYDRFWEARKIWGGIVNYSRTWGNQVMSFVSNKKGEPLSSDALQEVHRDLIYRHIAWLNALRLHLRLPKAHSKKQKASVRKLMGDDITDQHWIDEVSPFVSDDEYQGYQGVKNIPTQLIRRQGEELRKHMEVTKLIEDFRHMEMMRVLEEFYNLQGKCERIKNTPLPRQYAFFSKVFTWIFILLLPFGMLGEFSSMGHHMEVLAIPFCVLISWIFITMELVGDNSEDPFENFVNDVPMTALCRTIEIDLREMLGEKELPEGVAAVQGVLL